MRALVGVMIGVMLCSVPSNASPLVYQRETLTIFSPRNVPASSTAPEEKEQVPVVENPKEKATSASKKLSEKKPKTVLQERQHLFSITVETASSVQKTWMVQLASIKDNQAILYLFDAPSVASITPSDSTQANDMLFINSYGIITAIAKNIVPANLAEPMEITTPAKAILYVEAGLSDRLDIQPKDRVDYRAFPKAPNVTGQE